MGGRNKTGDGAGRPAPSDLPVAERREKAVAAAVRLLAVRERSAVELRQRLRQKGYDPETVVYALGRLQDQGLQDDRRFAETFAAEAVRRKGLAGRVVQSELRRRGIDKETAARASTRTPGEEADSARAIAERRAAQLAHYPPDVRARRLTAFLLRRGFPADLCDELARVVVGAPASDTTSDRRSFRKEGGASQRSRKR